MTLPDRITPKQRLTYPLILAMLLLSAGTAPAQMNPPEKTPDFPGKNQACLYCHEGIQPIRALDSEMMAQILRKGQAAGDPNGCVVCHGGNPAELKEANLAHKGAPEAVKIDLFTNHPGALGVNEKTCGQCHEDHTYTVRRSMMNSDAGKMKNILWSWGIDTDSYDHKYGNYDIDDPDGGVPRFGTETYKKYMQRMAEAYPEVYAREIRQIPQVDLATLKDNPAQAAFAYLRNCNKCHMSIEGGGGGRGLYRGMGCAACHVLFGAEGRYEGKDKALLKSIKESEEASDRAPAQSSEKANVSATVKEYGGIPRAEEGIEVTGHVLVHSIQSSQKAKVSANGKEYSGIPVSTCTSCHAAGRRIGLTYQGLFGFTQTSPFDENGNPQPTFSGYRFKPIREDHHHRIYDDEGKQIGGMLCQDCHTTNAMHGNGNIGTTALATVEVGCADCHGTPEKYPWELPLGFGEEFEKELDATPRGLSDKPMDVTAEFATAHPARSGFLLSTRGNPLGNVVKDGEEATLYSAGGGEFKVPLLKRIREQDTWKTPVKAKTAMMAVEKHIDSLECYACHSTWVASYFGYHYKMDFSQGKQSIDWLASGQDVRRDGNTAESLKTPHMTPGTNTGSYSYYRWENPVLGINGEGRVTPLVGVIQTVGSVVDTTGDLVLSNRVFRTAPNMEGAGEEGQLAIELTPVNPHSVSREPRECSSCHRNDVSMGYGIDGGIYDSRPDKAVQSDAATTRGEQLSRFSRAQVSAINGLAIGLEQIVDRSGKQTQTVGSHWPLSRPLTDSQRARLDRGGTCLACHKDLPKGTIPIAMLKQISETFNYSFAENEAHAELLAENNRLIALVKFAGISGGILLLGALLIFLVSRRYAKR